MPRIAVLLTVALFLTFSLASCVKDIPGTIVKDEPVSLNGAPSTLDFSYVADVDLRHLSNYINEPASIKITKGKLNISLGTPKDTRAYMLMQDLLNEMWHESEYSNITSNTLSVPADLKIFGIYNIAATIDGHNYWLDCMEDHFSTAVLVYASKNAAVLGTVKDETSRILGDAFEITQSIESWDCNFEAGWNYLIRSFVIQNGLFIANITAAQTPPEGYKWVVEAE